MPYRLLLCLLPMCAWAFDQATIDDAAGRGLAALVALQAGDGSFAERPGVTALAGLALLSGGHTPERGRWHEASRRTLRAVLAAQDGFTGLVPGGGDYLYDHGFAALYLAQCAGMSDLREAGPAVSAVEYLVRAQDASGGWRFAQGRQGADISVTICQVAALRAANDIARGGRDVDAAVGRAVDYVRACARPDGSFGYIARDGAAAELPPVRGVARAAAAATTLLAAGVDAIDRDDPDLHRALRFLRRYAPEHLRVRGPHFWYAHYYTAQAMRRSPDADDWASYRALAFPIILGLQDADGAWSRPEEEIGRAYATAMALIILQMDSDYLPAFQR